MATIKTKENYIQLEGEGMPHLMKYNFFWLRENCRCTECYNSITNQRNIHQMDLPLDIKPISYSCSEDSVNITWNDDHVSEYNVSWLQNNAEAEKRPEPVLWSGDISNKVAFVTKDDLASSAGLTQLVKSILQYGVGFITNVAPNMKATEEVMRKIGPPMHTMYGPGMWQFTDSMDYLDTSYTNVALGAHTDTTYFLEPAGLINFHCTYHDGEGGKTFLVDGFRAAKEVELADHKLYNCLKTQPTEFSCIDKGYHYVCCTPTLTFSDQNQLEMIRYNVYDRSSRIPQPQNNVDLFYKSLRLFGNAIRKASGEFSFQLKPGTVAVINNWRVLHGRSAYTGKRQITGCYMSMGNFLSKSRLLNLIF